MERVGHPARGHEGHDGHHHDDHQQRVEVDEQKGTELAAAGTEAGAGLGGRPGGDHRTEEDEQRDDDAAGEAAVDGLRIPLPAHTDGRGCDGRAQRDQQERGRDGRGDVLAGQHRESEQARTTGEGDHVGERPADQGRTECCTDEQADDAERSAREQAGARGGFGFDELDPRDDA